MEAKNAQARSPFYEERLNATKRAAQYRDCALIAFGAMPLDAMFLIRPEMLRGAKVGRRKRSLVDRKRND